MIAGRNELFSFQDGPYRLDLVHGQGTQIGDGFFEDLAHLLQFDPSSDPQVQILREAVAENG